MDTASAVRVNRRVGIGCGPRFDLGVGGHAVSGADDDGVAFDGAAGFRLACGPRAFGAGGVLGDLGAGFSALETAFGGPWQPRPEAAPDGRGYDHNRENGHSGDGPCDQAGAADHG
jgi:hypothetical protein